MKLKHPLFSITVLFLLFSFLPQVAAETAILSWQANAEKDLRGYNLYIGKAPRVYGPPINIGKSTTTYTLDGLETNSVYYFALTAVDGSENESGFSPEIRFRTGRANQPNDTSPPRIDIKLPTTGTSYKTNTDKVRLSGQADDNYGISKIEWSSSSKAKGIAQGTENWFIEDLDLLQGENRIIITAIDTAGNKSTKSINVVYKPNQNIVTSLAAASGKAYGVNKKLIDGNQAYIDRTYTYQHVPQPLIGCSHIVTANDDKTTSGRAHLKFTVSRRARVYIAHDDRITTKPAWLKGFDDTGLNLTTDVPMSLYTKVYEAGLVTLGGNGGGKGSSMYTVAVASE